MAFLISTPESGVDSIAITYALLDPIMTIVRPIVAFFTAAAAGIAENVSHQKNIEKSVVPDLSCPVDGCCDGNHCAPETHKRHHSFTERVISGIRYAFTDFWSDLATWFFLGLLLAGFITTIIPDDLFTRYLGGGLTTMLVMLAVGIPLYICATASTPIAAALILKGISPGAALVFLLAGPATNVASLTVMLGILGRRTTVIYLAIIATSAVFFGLVLDQVYTIFSISAQAMMGQASEVVPSWAALTGALILLLLSIKPLAASTAAWFKTKKPVPHKMQPPPISKNKPLTEISDCGPT